MPPLFALHLRLRTGLIRTTLLSILLTAATASTALADTIRVACIGDYGWDGPRTLAVANLVDGWNPDAVITLGDNAYEGSPIDDSVGKYYAHYIGDYVGDYGPGDTQNRFFPTLGNHDYSDGGGVDGYLDYFTLPGAGVASTNTSGTETYYDVVLGPVHFFGLDSNSQQQDGTSPGSVQGQWLQTQLAASTATWKIVYFHHCPYSSGDHGNETHMQWPFEEWGADAVFSGHDHDYERSQVGGIPYFVNGSGGRSLRPFTGDPIPESVVRYDEDNGAMLITADDYGITFEFHSVADGGTRIDSLTIGTPSAPLQFGAVPLGEVAWDAAEIRNGGSQDLEVLDIGVAGPEAGDFSVQVPELPVVLAPGEAIYAAVSFAPTAVGSRTADLVITTDDADESPIEMPMSGAGVYSSAGPVMFEESVTGTATDSRSVTTDPLSAVGSNLYLAAISSKGYSPVTDVSGLGATWSLVRAQCGGRSQTGIEVWMGEGATSDGTVTADFSDRSTACAIIVARYAGGNAEDRLGVVASRNTNGVEGSCSGGNDGADYELDMLTSGPSSLVFGAVAKRHRLHSPGDSWALQEEVRAGSGGAVAGIEVVDRLVESPAAVVLDGTFSSDVDWGVIGVEIRGGSGDAPHIFVDPRTVDFGRVGVDEVASTTVQIRNDGTADLVGDVELNGASSSEFTLFSGGGPFTLAPGRIRTVRVHFAPTSEGFQSAELRITSNDLAEGRIDVAVGGEGAVTSPQIVLTPPSFDFGDTPIPLQSNSRRMTSGLLEGARSRSALAGATFTVGNDGDADLHVSTVDLAGPDAAQFAVDAGEGYFTLAPGETRTISVSFHPTSLGPKTAELRVASDDGPATSTLSGTGALPPEDVTFVETVTGGSSGGGTVTSDPLSAALTSDLYLATISSKNHRSVQDVQGLGLGWTLVREQCGGRSQTGMSVFMAFGPSGGGPVTATFSDDPSVAVIAVSHYAGVNPANPLGNVISGNTRGLDGSCSGGTDQATYSLDFSTTAHGAVVFAAVGLRSRANAPGDGYTERAYLVEGSGGTAAGLAIQDRNVASPSSLVVEGECSGTVDWSLVAVEIVPAAQAGGAADISVAPSSHDFGDVVGGDSVPHTFVVVNEGTAPLAVDGTELVGPEAGDFTIDSGEAPFALSPGATRDVVVSFAPSGPGAKSATLRLTSNAPNRSPLDLALTGNGLPAPDPDIAVTPTAHDYGSVFVGVSASHAFEVRNDGPGSLDVVTTSLSGSDAASFSVESGGAPFTLAPGETRSVVLDFAPIALGAASATLRVTSNDPDEATIDVGLAGTGNAPPQPTEVTHLDTATGGSTGSGSVTSDPLPASAGNDLHLAAVSSKAHRSVQEVEGLGLTWTLVREQCGAREQAGMTVFMAQGPSTGGAVTATFTDAPAVASITVSRYSGADPASPVGSVGSANTRGSDGSCSGGTDEDTYSLDLAVTSHGAVAWGAVGLRSRSHLPGSGYDERAYVVSGSGGTSAGIAIEDRIVSAPGTVVVDGEFDGTVDWALVALEILPAAANPAADIAVAPGAYDWGDVVGGTSAAHTFVVANVGTEGLTVSGTAIIGADATEFTLDSGAAPFVLNPGETRDVIVSFAPAGPGLKSATLRLTSDDPDEATLDVGLGGTGVGLPEPDVTVNPSSHDFGFVILGQSTSHAFEIRNDGGSNLDVVGTDLTGLDASFFALTGGGAPFTLAPGETRSVVIEFAPAALGGASAALRVTSDDPDEGTVDVALAGTGDATPPPADLAFVETATGGSSEDETVTSDPLPASSNDDLYLVAVSAKSHRSVQTVEGLGLTWTLVREQCGARSQTGMTVFRAQGPSSGGEVTATFDDAPDVASIVVSRYSGADPASPLGTVVAANTHGVDGSCSGGTDRDSYSVGLTTTTPGAVVFGAVGVRHRTPVPGGDYEEREYVVHGDGGTSAGIVVQDRTVESPTTVTVDGDVDREVDWALVAVEIRPAPNLSPAIVVAPSSHDFGDVTVGSTATQTFEIRNDGTAPLIVVSTELVGAESASFDIGAGAAPFTLNPGETRDVSVEFTPIGLGPSAMTLRIVSNDPDEGTVDVSLTGTGVPVPEPDIAVTPPSHDFGDVLVGGTATQAFEVRNDGAASLDVTTSELTGAGAASYAIESGGAPFTLASGETRQVTIRFTPGAPETTGATFRIQSDDPDEGTVDVALAGTGVQPDIAVTPAAHDFGDVLAGDTASTTFEVRNEGAADLTVTATDLTGPGAASFAIVSGGAPFVLPPGETRDVAVDFTPGGLDTSDAVLGIASDDPDEATVDIALTGTGVEPDVAVTPTSHDFGNVLLGGAPTTSFEIRNDGGADLAVSGTDLSGPGAADYAVTDGGAPFVLAPGESRTVSVSFTPAGLGTSDATLTVASDDPDEASVDVALTGAGVEPDLNVSPASHDFGDILAGTTASQTFEIRNDGTADLEVVTIEVVGADSSSFQIESGGAPFTLVPGESRDVTILFAPAVPGVRTATLRLTSDDPGEPAVDVGLAGAGVEPDVAVTPASHDFGDVRVGTTPSQTIQIRNDGTADLTVSAADLVGSGAAAYAIGGGGAPFVLATGETRDISVSFVPTGSGVRDATLRVTSDDPDQATVDVAFSGTGVEPDVTVSPAFRDYGNVLLGAVASSSFEIRNDGTSDLAVTATDLNGSGAAAYTIVGGGAPFVLAPGESRDVSIDFAPGGLGTSDATMSVTSDDPDETTVDVALTGTGVQPEIAVAPMSYDYGNVLLGESASSLFEIRNDGSADLTVTATVLSGPGASAYTISGGGAPFILAPGAVRNVSVGFTPPGQVTSDATLRVTSDDADEATVDVALTGTGVEPAVTVTPASHDFGDVLVGATATQAFQIRNDGTADLDVTGTDLVGAGAASFEIESGGAPFTLTPGESHDVAVVFTADAPGARTAALRVTSDDPGDSTFDVSLVGVGVQADISVAPASHDYGEILVGTTASRVFVVRNDGSFDLNVGAIELTGADASEFEIEGGTGAPVTLAPGDSLEASVRFAPVTPGTATAALRVTSDDPDEGTVDVALAGTGVVPDIVVSPLGYDYGNVFLGDSALHDFEIRNDGSAVLDVATTEITGLDASSFSIESGGAPFTLVPGASRVVSVRFVPVVLGPAHASLRITSDDPDQGILDVALDGSAFDYGLDDIVLLETESGGSTSSKEVQTGSRLTAVSGNLYLAAVSSKRYEPTISVSGLGLVWTPVVSQCSARDQTGLDIWMAQGTPTGDAHVTATFQTKPNTAAIIVSRYAGVDEGSPLGNWISVNGNGVSGDCDGGSEASGYSFDLTTTTEGAVVFAAAAMRNKDHSPGSGWTETDEFREGNGGSATSVATMDRLVAAPTVVSVSGTFSGTIDWAAAGVELRPATIILTSAARNLAGAGDDLGPVRPPTAPGEPGPVTSIDGPPTFRLSTNRPNPFRGETTLEYALPAPAFVEIVIYDAAGRAVRRLANETQAAGVREIRWNGRNESGAAVGSGVYFLRLRAGSETHLRKLILSR